MIDIFACEDIVYRFYQFVTTQYTTDFYIIYSTLNKITQFWLVESSTINPKLYSIGVPIKFPWKRCNFVECTINKNHTTFSNNSWIIGTRDFENSQIALA